jgi:hypothetical protein
MCRCRDEVKSMFMCLCCSVIRPITDDVMHHALPWYSRSVAHYILSVNFDIGEVQLTRFRTCIIQSIPAMAHCGAFSAAVLCKIKVNEMQIHKQRVASI